MAPGPTLRGEAAFMQLITLISVRFPCSQTVKEVILDGIERTGWASHGSVKEARLPWARGPSKGRWEPGQRPTGGTGHAGLGGGGW